MAMKVMKATKASTKQNAMKAMTAMKAMKATKVRTKQKAMEAVKAMKAKKATTTQQWDKAKWEKATSDFDLLSPPYSNFIREMYNSRDNLRIFMHKDWK